MARVWMGKGSDTFSFPKPLTLTLRGVDDVGCRCIITDAYRDRAGWYARYGFVPFEGAADTGPQRIFLDIRTLRLALKQAR